MYLDYGTQISPTPIKLSIGTLRKPKLIEISDITFERFNVYEVFIKMTPEKFYTKIQKDTGKDYWNSLSEEQKEEITLYKIILNDEITRNTYIEIFNFFFLETVIFKEGFFLLLKEDIEEQEITPDKVQGVIHEDIFLDVLDLIQQICCVHDKESSEKDIKFKNNLAKNLFNRIQKAQKKEKAERKADINLTIPNIISSVSSKHPSLNYSNIWDITIFQLLDTFGHLQVNTMHDIDSIRVAVWGDEKKTFNAALWYKNQYDKQ